MGFNGKEMKWNMVHDTASGKFNHDCSSFWFQGASTIPLVFFLYQLGVLIII